MCALGRLSRMREPLVGEGGFCNVEQSRVQRCPNSRLLQGSFASLSGVAWERAACMGAQQAAWPASLGRVLGAMHCAAWQEPVAAATQHNNSTCCCGTSAQ